MSATRMKRVLTAGVAGILGLVFMLAPAWADIVHNDDVIIRNSLCVGFDCLDGEDFGFDTIRLKENNTRIKFDDTSTTTGFPSTDWQLTANDDGSGGANLFAIDDVTNNRRPFTVEANSRNNALVIDSTGRIGLRTNNPVLDVHAKTNNTPGLRLEQDNTGGFQAQTWDVAGNEANFFVRDVTGGSRLPFRIRPGAPTSSVDIASSGNVGIGTTAPKARLHVGTIASTPVVSDTDLFVADDPTSVLAVRSGTEGAEVYVRATPGRGSMGTSTKSVLDVRTNNKRRIFIAGGNGNIGIGRGGPKHPMHFKSGARVTDAGQFVNASDRAVKDDFLTADTRAVLEALVDMPLWTWRHVDEDESVRHIGPTAQDFGSAFGFGNDDTAISTVDADGVALASIQALYEIVQEMQAENAALQAEVERLKTIVDP